MKIIQVDAANLDEEHLCCALSSAQNAEGVARKKEWMRARLEEGLVFKKLDVRGKVFIEYLPAEHAWRPVEAPGYIFIHCLWVSGRYQKSGWGARLLEECLRDARGTHGVAVLSSRKKTPYLTDRRFYEKHGFETCDEAGEYRLLVRKNRKSAPDPRIPESAKRLRSPHKKGVVIYYSPQCPFTHHYVDELLEVAREQGLPTKKIAVKSAEEAQQVPSPYGVFNIFRDGTFLTHKIVSAPAFARLLG